MNEQQIFDYLVAAGMTKPGAAGLMGNLIAESGLRANNLQNGYEKALGMDDETYTAAVDSGAYGNFVHDSAGYGLAQWTYHTRKYDLLKYAQKTGRSIGDIRMQLEFMLAELKAYTSVWAKLKTAAYVRDASDIVLTQYERPADMSESVKTSRATLGQGVLDRCADPEPVVEKTDSLARQFSPLATKYVDFGTSLSNPRKNKIIRSTPHHAATVTADPMAIAKSHRNNPGRESSANYYIGGGLICGGVPETRRAWTSGTGNKQGTNDHTAITIEVANSTGAPDWKISDADYAALVRLMAEICLYYDITPHFDGTPKGTITIHKMFQETACPGPYLESLIRSGKLESDVIAAMGGQQMKPQPKETLYRVQVGAFKQKENAMRRLQEVKAKGLDGIVVQILGLYKVQVGAYKVKDNADGMVARLARLGYMDAFITIEQGQMVL